MPAHASIDPSTSSDREPPAAAGNARQRDRAGQERGREPAALPARPGLGRRGLRGRQPEHRRDRRGRRRARRDGRPVPLQRDVSQEEELGTREPAVPQRVGPDRRCRRGRRPRAGRRRSPGGSPATRPTATTSNSRYYFLGRRIRHCGYSECWNLRLFKHRLGRYEKMPDATGGRTGDNEAHEHVELQGRVLRLENELDHHAYPTIAAWVEKHNRYAIWEAALYERFLNEPIPATIGRGKRFKRRLKKIAWRLPMRPLVRFRLRLLPATRVPRRQAGPDLLRPAGLLRLPRLGQPLRAAASSATRRRTPRRTGRVRRRGRSLGSPARPAEFTGALSVSSTRSSRSSYSSSTSLRWRSWRSSSSGWTRCCCRPAASRSRSRSRSWSRRTTRKRSRSERSPRPRSLPKPFPCRSGWESECSFRPDSASSTGHCHYPKTPGPRRRCRPPCCGAGSRAGRVAPLEFDGEVVVFEPV